MWGRSGSTVNTSRKMQATAVMSYGLNVMFLPPYLYLWTQFIRDKKIELYRKKSVIY